MPMRMTKERRALVVVVVAVVVLLLLEAFLERNERMEAMLFGLVSRRRRPLRLLLWLPWIVYSGLFVTEEKCRCHWQNYHYYYCYYCYCCHFYRQ
jgi:hypothetical protein